MNKRIFLWWLSYLVVLVIPLAFSMVIYSRVTANINNSINRNQETTLTQIRLAVDDMINSAMNVSNDLSINGDVQSLIYSEYESLEPRKKIALKDIQESVSNYQTTNNKVNDIYIYFETMDSVLSTKMLYRRKNFDILSNDLQIPSVKIIEYVKASKKYLLIKENRNGSLVYFQNITTATKPHRIVAFFQIDQLEKFMREFAGSSGSSIYIIGRDGEYLSSDESMKGLPHDLYQSGLSEKEMIFSEKWEDKDLIISHIPSKILDLSYVIISPQKIYFSALQEFQVVMTVTLILCFIIVSIVAFILARKNYSPIKKMLAIYRNQLGNAKNNENEYLYLESRLRELLKENVFSKYTISDQAQQMRKSTLKDLLRDCNLQIRKNDFTIEMFCVLLFKVKNSAACLSVEAGMSSTQAEELTLFVISNVMNELLNNTYQTETIIMDSSVVCVVRIPDDDSDIKNQSGFNNSINVIVEKGKQFLNENFQMTFFAAISNIDSGAEKLAHAYHGVSEIVAYKQFVGNDDLNGISVVGEVDEKKISAAEKRRINNLLIAGEIENARSAVNQLMVTHFPPEGRLMTAQLKVYIIKDMLISALNEMKEEQDKEPRMESVYSREKRIFHCQTVNELHTAVNAIFDDMLNRRNILVTHKDRVAALLEYLENNLGDPLLNVSTLVDKFKIDRYYATKEVKKRTGFALLDYIHKLRLDRAKQLLLENKLTITQIASVCGFTNPIALNRVFQKYEGIAAGKYKKLTIMSSLHPKEGLK